MMRKLVSSFVVPALVLLFKANAWSPRQMRARRVLTPIPKHAHTLTMLPKTKTSSSSTLVEEQVTEKEEGLIFFNGSRSASTTKKQSPKMEDQVALLDLESQSSSTTTRRIRSAEEVERGADSDAEIKKVGMAIGATLLLGIIFTMSSMGISVGDVWGGIQSAFANPSQTLEGVVNYVDSMGPLGVVYFGVAYTIAEILAIPAIPLTASAGYLFGPVLGTGVVLVSASIAASVSFVIGRTLLRDYVERVIQEYPRFVKLDRAIGKEGFKLMLLLRISPLFPFALSNYLYGATSINFTAFFWGTLLGFAPGTAAYVYTGYVGKALTDGSTNAYPWFVYAGGLVIFAGVLKVLADTATRLVDAMGDEEEADEEHTD